MENYRDLTPKKFIKDENLFYHLMLSREFSENKRNETLKFLM